MFGRARHHRVRSALMRAVRGRYQPSCRALELREPILLDRHGKGRVDGEPAEGAQGLHRRLGELLGQESKPIADDGGAPVG